MNFFFFFFSSFFDERNVVELTKQTRQRIESKDLKTLCETRKLYIFLVSLCENEKTLYIFFFNHFPQFYFTTILLMILWKTWKTSHLCQQTTVLVVPDENFHSLIMVRELSFTVGLTALIVLVFVHKTCSTENTIHQCAPLPVAISRT